MLLQARKGAQLTDGPSSIGRLERDANGLLAAHERGSDLEVAKPLAAALQAARGNAQRQMSVNNLKQLALAMHVYHERFKRFPPALSTDAAGKPLLSWRVHLLPYLEQEALYKQFKQDEPWDSEHNKKLIERMPPTFADSAAQLIAVTEAAPLTGLVSATRKKFETAFCDGSVRVLSDAIDPKILWLLLNANDGKPVDYHQVR